MTILSPPARRAIVVGAVIGNAACGSAGASAPLTDGGADARAPDGGDAGDDGDAGCEPIGAPNAWARWVMPNPATSGLPNPARYTVSDGGNEVVDEITGLIWQRTADPGSYTWDAAKQACACLTIDGAAGYRLPSRIELVSIADWTQAPSIDVAAFPGTPPESFWTSSVLAGDPGLGWLVSFDTGFATYGDMGYAYRARCVRGGVTTGPVERYVVANGTVRDTATKLTWQQEISSDTFPLADAASYCSSLALDGGGWRLPSIGELQTIVDESTNPSIDLVTFPATPSEYFWSSSPVVGDPSRAWTCFFANGSTYAFTLTKPRNLRCVR